MDTHAKARLLTVLATVFAVVGCQGNSEALNLNELSEINESLSNLTKETKALKTDIASLRDADATTHSNDSATEAVASAREKLDQNDYVAAYDFLLAAIRLAPSSPEVFDSTLKFTRAAVQSDDDEALDLAYDLYVRVAGLIPFQPLSKIVSAREEHVKAGELFEPAAPFVAPDPLESIRSRITQTHAREMPGQVASLVVQAIRADLESVAVTIGSDPSVSSDDCWRDWHDLNTELESFETEVLATMYGDLGHRVAAWQNDTTEILKRYENAKPQQFASIGDGIVAKVHDGYRLRSEIVPFVEADIASAKSDQDKLNKRLDYLERTKEWMHNQHALATIEFVRENKELAPLEKLKRLAYYDDRRLSPYVLQRYQEEWNQWFEELDGDEQKIEATRIRILGEAIK